MIQALTEDLQSIDQESVMEEPGINNHPGK